ncbi:MAG: hypothetical protein RMX96_03160 [Nostoc sp. ChiSLP02]|nr:hypothetical protein [Nostoc sp. DedSLP05]MDZ8097763.1 hypothetical protein [Nostoc sp. DedSLP01]MDZ8183848.1 hypothetical protein [Nostoc sp. ChiSLP02]
MFSCFYIFGAALTYQIEYLVRRQIISAYSGKKEINTDKLTTNIETDKEFNKLSVEMVANRIKSNVLSNEEEKATNNQRRYHISSKNRLLIFVALLIPLVIYVSLQLLENITILPKIKT